MSRDRTMIDRARLWQAARERSAGALASGALRPILTEQCLVEDGGVRFVVRAISSLREKDRAAEQDVGRSARRANPFLPPDPDLLVGDISATHVAVLNKFPVLEPHLLIVTRAFEHQEAALTRADFEALAIALASADGLGFYNGGTVAGASQPHKHLQLVPLPLAAEGPAIPITPLLGHAVQGRIPDFRFRHAFLRLDRSVVAEPDAAAAAMHGGYRAMCMAADLGGPDPDGHLPPYNLLATRSWMMLVPRSRESALGVSVNGLGFAGALLVRDAMQMAAVARLGPMTVLRRVTFGYD
jgi:ATP adenylyltransferase